MHRIVRAVAAAFVLSGVTTPVQAQLASVIEGHVFDQARRPLLGAVVEVIGTPLMTRTDASGAYTIRSVPAGMVQIRASGRDVKPFTITGVRLPSGQVVTQDFQLETMSPVQEAVNGTILMRFQLIRPTNTRTTDKAIATVDSALRALFQWNGYRLLSTAAMTADVPAPRASPDVPSPRPSFTSQMLQADGKSYRLEVFITSATPQKATMGVTLSSYSGTPTAAPGKPPAASVQFLTLLSTTVTVSFGHTVVLGTTQTGTSAAGDAGNGTLILVVKPELQGGQ